VRPICITPSFCFPLPDTVCVWAAEKMLEHEYFWTDPLPRKASNPTPLLPQNVSCHEFETKQMAKRRQCARHFYSNIAFQVAC
jgi:hypothetical protein